MRFRRQEFPQEREDENLQMMVKGSLRTTAVRHTQPAASPEWSRSKDPEIQRSSSRHLNPIGNPMCSND